MEINCWTWLWMKFTKRFDRLGERLNGNITERKRKYEWCHDMEQCRTCAFIQRNASWPSHVMSIRLRISWWTPETKGPCVAGHNTGNLEMPWVSWEPAPIISHSPIPSCELLNPLSRVTLCNTDDTDTVIMLHIRSELGKVMHFH